MPATARVPDRPGELDPIGTPSHEEVQEELRRLLGLGARAEACAGAVVAEAQRGELPAGLGFVSLSPWPTAVTSEPPAVCRSRVRLAPALPNMDRTHSPFTVGDPGTCRVQLPVDAREAAPEVLTRD